MKYLINELSGQKEPVRSSSKRSRQAHLRRGLGPCRTGVVTEHGFKIGQRPGFIFVIEGDSEEAVRATISNIPVAQGAGSISKSIR